MNKKNALAIFVIALLFISAFFILSNQSSKKVHSVADIKYVKLAGQKIGVELAITPEEKAQGLSGRIGLEEDKGMLFVFDIPGWHSFWMQDMNFPIDMIWLGEDLRIIYIEKNALPESFPATFGPQIDSMYVLEVVSGFSEKNNLKVGDRVEFIY